MHRLPFHSNMSLIVQTRDHRAGLHQRNRALVRVRLCVPASTIRTGRTEMEIFSISKLMYLSKFYKDRVRIYADMFHGRFEKETL